MNVALPSKRLSWDFNNESSLLQWEDVATVCQESLCPNRYECSQLKIATFMIGGKVCTRSCNFCHIDTGRPPHLSKEIRIEEKNAILKAAQDLQLEFLVITSVARDDEEELLAEHFAEITNALSKKSFISELLIPDFHAEHELLNIVASAKPAIIAQNMETVKELSKLVRPQASYERTLNVFRYFKKHHPNIVLKSGIMVGLGENLQQIEKTLTDLQDVGVEIITIGQYLQPSQKQLAVKKIYTQKEFAIIEEIVSTKKFLAYEVGPYVRSSYLASKSWDKVKLRLK